MYRIFLREPYDWTRPESGWFGTDVALDPDSLEQAREMKQVYESLHGLNGSERGGKLWTASFAPLSRYYIRKVY